MPPKEKSGAPSKSRQRRIEREMTGSSRSISSGVRDFRI